MNERYDIAIIGSGPAGISAALNAKIRNKRFIIFGSNEISTKLVKAHKINNYLGFYGKSGVEIRDEFANHLKAMDIEITEEKVNSIYAMGDYFTLMVNDKMYEATSIILATGVNFGKPFKGEEEFLGKGVGYCATCDAPLYKDKVVTIIAYNKHEEAEANFIGTIASKVYYVPMYKQEIEVDSSIEIIKDIPVEIVGDSSVKKLILKNSEIEKDMVLVDFFAEWCGPCKMISPILDELQAEFEDKINIIKVNVDNSMDIAEQYNISNIPALVLLKKGQEVQRLIGFSPKQVIKENIEKHL